MSKSHQVIRIAMSGIAVADRLRAIRPDTVDALARLARRRAMSDASLLFSICCTGGGGGCVGMIRATRLERCVELLRGPIDLLLAR